MKWTIIGAGGIADRRTIPAILENSGNTILAVMDRNESVAKNVARKYNIPKYYSDIEKMLKENDCDAVYIGTPVACHYEQAMLALKYNKNVFLEKPIALNAVEGKKLIDAFKEKKKELFVGYMMKYHNLHMKAQKLVKNQMIGDVVNIRLQFSCWYPDIANAWRQNKALGGGGAFMDLGVHAIELAEYILSDEIIDLKGFYNTQTFNYEVEDSAIMIFKTKKGTLGHIDVNFNIPDSASISKLEIYGTKGYIICNNTLGQEEKGELMYLYAPQGDYEAIQTRTIIKPKRFKGKNGNLYLKQINAFSNLINKNKIDYKCAKKALHVQEIVDKFYLE